MKQYKTKLDSFIGGWYIDKKLCDELINFYHLNRNKTITGSISYKNNIVIDKDKKDCTQLPINYMYNESCIKKYRIELQKCLEKYVKIYTELYYSDKFNIINNYNIQHYLPNQGFKIWHNERGQKLAANRVLVFMTYLNDVKDGGTYFKYQKLTVPCEKGLTLIWPTDWTHTHKGQISKTHEKYIITGWYNFI